MDTALTCDPFVDQPLAVHHFVVGPYLGTLDSLNDLPALAGASRGAATSTAPRHAHRRPSRRIPKKRIIIFIPTTKALGNQDEAIST